MGLAKLSAEVVWFNTSYDIASWSAGFLHDALPMCLKSDTSCPSRNKWGVESMLIHTLVSVETMSKVIKCAGSFGDVELD